MFKNFANILLTGASGNSAYFFLKKLEKENFDKVIKVITRDKFKNSYFNQFKLKFKIFNGDINDKEFLSKSLTDIDLVLHTANIENSQNIVEVGTEKKVKWFIWCTLQWFIQNIRQKELKIEKILKKIF